MNTMHKVDLWIGEDLKRYKEIHYRLSKRLSRLAVTGADERLTSFTKNGRKYYSEVWTEDGVKKTRYLGTANNKEVLEIQEKRFIRKILPVLEKRIRTLEKNPEEMRPIDFEEINSLLPAVYRLPSEQIKAVIGPNAEEKWYAEALKEKTKDEKRYGVFRPEELVHRAKDGTMMRSKSEVVIANELINYGIPFIYELPVDVMGFIMHPDFMFYSFSRMKPMIWEHAGMIGDAGYKKGFEDRMDDYMRAGLAPCTDIILTFDTTDGHVDAELIDKIIEDYR